MKTKLIILFALLGSALMAGNPDQIIGYWLTSEGNSQIEIYKERGKYYGKIVWLEEPYNDDGNIKKDKENPDDVLKNRPLRGLKILKDFEYDKGDNEWDDGKIYDPEVGKTYDCYMWFDDDPDKLKVKGYIGFSVIGRSSTWKRESAKRD